RWRSALLSTMYPPTTSKLSAGDSSFNSSTGTSSKRCRSPTTTVTSFIHATRALVLSCANLLPPRKRVDADIGMEVDVRIDVEDEVEDEVESSDRGTIEVGVDVVVEIDIPNEGIKTGHRELEARSLISGGERSSLLKLVASLERSNARL
nr:hypothetical protein [Tanacetum cinerariifolium]